jgi:hypothetical protein
VARKPRGVSYREDLKGAIEDLLPPHVFCRWSVHGNSDWTPQKLAWMAILMSWEEASTLGERFEHTRRLLRVLQPRWKLPTSYAGFVAALEQHTPVLRAALGERLRPTADDTSCWRVGGWLAFAVDGSRFEAPRTVVNERRLGCAGKERTGPQVFQTTLQPVGTGLPWDFRLGPGTESERRQLDDLRTGLPSQALLLADAGFVSYELFVWLTSQQQAFLMRVGGNIRLLTSLGWDCEQQGRTVYLWPDARRSQPPLVLRLIVIQDTGKLPVCLLTNVLEVAELSDETACRLYQQRWGIEVYYRTAKQTFGHRRLLSRSPQAALLEQTWKVLGLWFLDRLTASAVEAAGHAPRERSWARARNVVRRVLRQALNTDLQPKGTPLKTQLAQAVKDRSRRRGPKQTRPWPRKKEQRPPKPPKLQEATDSERQRAKHLWHATPLRL